MFKVFSIRAFFLALMFFAATLQINTLEAQAAARSETFVRLDHVTAAEGMAHGITIHSGAAILVVTALRDDVVRVRIGATGQLPEDASWAVLPAARTASVAVTPFAEGNKVGFTTPKLRVTIQRSPLALTITDLDGNILIEDLPGRPVEFNGTSFRIYKKSPVDEHYFGLGDKPGPLDRRNHAFSNWATDSYGWQESTDPIYKAIPFFLTFNKSVSTGIYLDNTWRSSFEFNKEYQNGYSFGAENGPLDYYVFYGPEPKKVIETWAWLTGLTPLPPLWSLGYQQCRYSYYPESEARRIANRLRSERIPADVLYLDIDYQLKNRPFTVDAERFPHFDQLIQDLKAQHLHTVLITDLHIADQPNIGYKPFDEGMAGDHFVKNPDGSMYVAEVWPGKSVFPDFTRKTSRDWWGSLYQDFVSRGVAGFWNDMNEPAIFNVPSKTMPDDVQHRIDEPGFTARTASHLEIHNIFGMQNSRGTFEGLRKIAPDVRPFVLTRASFAGGQRFSATWTGDNLATWSHLRQTTPQLLNLGLSGFAMSGADVGGFGGSPQPALLTRWLQLAAFQPIDRDHTAKGTRSQEPWENGNEHDLNLRRAAIEERYRLMPYLYTVAEEMSRTGVPIIRPLFLEFPQGAMDRQPLDLKNTNSFLFGPDLLVADSPLPETLDDYSVALPPGGWYDYWTGIPIRSHASAVEVNNIATTESEITIHPSADILPVFVRAGSIIPEQPLIQSTDEIPQGPLTLRVYPPLHVGGECTGSLYLDDGSSYAYQKGDFLRTDFTCQSQVNGLTVTIRPRQGTHAAWWNQLSIEIYGATKPITSATTASGPVLVRYDSEHQRNLILVPDDGRGFELKLTN